MPPLLLGGCAGGPPPDPATEQREKARVADLFLRIRLDLQQGRSDSLWTGLAAESHRWVEDLRHAAASEPANRLAARPFAEVILVLALRVERRRNPAFDGRARALLHRLSADNPLVRKNLVQSDPGEPRLRGREAFIGLKEAENVPVFYFVKENGLWRFHLARTVPFILQGLESLAKPYGSDNVERAAWALRRFGGITVDPLDLR